MITSIGIRQSGLLMRLMREDRAYLQTLRHGETELRVYMGNDALENCRIKQEVSCRYEDTDRGRL